MSFAKNEYTGDGATTDRVVSFPYIDQAHVVVTVAGVVTAFTWVNAGLIRILPAPAVGAFIRIRRQTSQNTRLVDYVVPSALTEEDLDNDSLQAFYMAQESIDRATESMGQNSGGNWDGDSRRITNVDDAVAAQDVVTKAQLDAAALAPVTPTAGSIANIPSGNLAAVEVQAALNELQSDIDTRETAAAHAADVATINAALALKAPLASPALTGNPTAPTPAASDNDTSIATSAFVQGEIASQVGPSTLNPLLTTLERFGY